MKFHAAIGPQRTSLLAGMARQRPGRRQSNQPQELVVIPGDKKRLSPADWQIIGNLCPCFAAAFFARAEAAIKAINVYWHNQGFRNGGNETTYLRN